MNHYQNGVYAQTAHRRSLVRAKDARRPRTSFSSPPITARLSASRTARHTGRARRGDQSPRDRRSAATLASNERAALARRRELTWHVDVAPTSSICSLHDSPELSHFRSKMVGHSLLPRATTAAVPLTNCRALGCAFRNWGVMSDQKLEPRMGLRLHCWTSSPIRSNAMTRPDRLRRLPTRRRVVSRPTAQRSRPSLVCYLKGIGERFREPRRAGSQARGCSSRMLARASRGSAIVPSADVAGPGQNGLTSSSALHPDVSAVAGRRRLLPDGSRRLIVSECASSITRTDRSNVPVKSAGRHTRVFTLPSRLAANRIYVASSTETKACGEGVARQPPSRSPRSWVPSKRCQLLRPALRAHDERDLRAIDADSAGRCRSTLPPATRIRSLAFADAGGGPIVDFRARSHLRRGQHVAPHSAGRLNSIKSLCATGHLARHFARSIRARPRGELMRDECRGAGTRARVSRRTVAPSKRTTAATVWDPRDRQASLARPSRTAVVPDFAGQPAAVRRTGTLYRVSLETGPCSKPDGVPQEDGPCHANRGCRQVRFRLRRSGGSRQRPSSSTTFRRGVLRFRRRAPRRNRTCLTAIAGGPSSSRYGPVPGSSTAPAPAKRG